MRRDERVLGWLLCAPAVAVMLLVTAWPLLWTLWLSLWRYDLRFPSERRFVGLDNLVAVLSAEAWWQALGNTALITGASVALELVLGMGIALLLHHLIVGRGVVRTAVLVPYAMVTVIAAMAWRLAFDPVVGFASVGPVEAWLAHRPTALAVIVLTEVWKTTPFMALILLAGRALVPEDLLRAARVDGATAWRRFRYVTLPLMRPSILVALLFRTLDAIRIFDTVWIQTRGAQGTETVSVLAYRTLLARLNLGLGAAVALLVFAISAGVAAAFVVGLRAGREAA